VIVALKIGALGGQPPEAPPEPLFDFVELWRVTSATPSIWRSRWIVWATAVWLVAQPLSVKVGTLPAGVAEDTALAAAGEEEEAAAGEEEEDDEDEDEDDEDEDDPPAAPICPVSDWIEVCPLSTRPSSWKACAQSKRVSTSEVTAASRCWRSATKLV